MHPFEIKAFLVTKIIGIRDALKYLCAVMFFGLAACSAGSNHYDVDRNEYPLKGIDVSAHNGIIDFESVAADTVAFVMIKATEGDDFCDAMFASNYDKAKAAGLLTGAYHFFRFGAPGHIQAYHFLNTIKGREMDLPLAIDVEEWKNDDDVPFAEVQEQLKSMVEVLRSNGNKVIIYTNRNGYNNFVKGELDDVPLWMCSLSGEPSTDWRMWQHSHSGTVAGISTAVDLDTFRGNLSEFEQWLSE